MQIASIVLTGSLVTGCSFAALPPTADDASRQADAGVDAITACTPGAPVCLGRDRAVCNAEGTGLDPALTTSCPLGCSDARCVTASNLPEAAQRACTADAPALAPPAGAIVTFQRGPGGIDVRCQPTCGATSTLSAIPLAPPGGPPIAMFCLGALDIPASVTITVDPAVTSALALFVAGDARIAGAIDVSGRDASRVVGGTGGPGGGGGGGPAADDRSGAPGFPPCGGGGGSTVGSNADAAGGGGGGGGHAASGGTGGQGRSAGTTAAAGGEGGGTCGDPMLSPLAGGGGGGGGGDGSCEPAACGWPGGGGGGAIQISVTGALALARSGTIRAVGGAGAGAMAGEAGEGGGGGGGAGGGVLLEAPTLALAGRVIVTGGDGGGSNAGTGGSGATTSLGGSTGPSQDSPREGGGGGGGAGGRVRLRGVGASCASGASVLVLPGPACSADVLRPAP